MCSFVVTRKKLILSIVIVLIFLLLSRCKDAENEQTGYVYILANSGICMVHPVELPGTDYIEAIEQLQQGKYLEAKQLLENILEQGKMMPSSNRIIEGKLLNAIGICDIGLFENGSAVKCLRLAREMILLETGKDSGDTAIILNNLGVALMELDQIEESSNALTQAEEINGILSRLDKSCFNINYAFNLTIQERTKDAIKIYEKEMNQIKVTDNNSRLIHAFLKGVLANFDSDTLGLETAKQYCDDAIKVYKEILGETHVEIARLLIFKSNIYLNLGDNIQAQKTYEEALKLLENTSNYNPEMIALIYNNLGILYRNKNEINKAIKYFNNSLEVSVNYKELQMGVANIYNNIGLCYVDKEAYDIAINYFIKAYLISKDIPYNLSAFNIYKDNIQYSYIKLDMDPFQFSEWLEQQCDVEIVLPAS